MTDHHYYLEIFLTSMSAIDLTVTETPVWFIENETPEEVCDELFTYLGFLSELSDVVNQLVRLDWETEHESSGFGGLLRQNPFVRPGSGFAWGHRFGMCRK